MVVNYHLLIKDVVEDCKSPALSSLTTLMSETQQTKHVCLTKFQTNSHIFALLL